MCDFCHVQHKGRYQCVYGCAYMCTYVQRGDGDLMGGRAGCPEVGNQKSHNVHNAGGLTSIAGADAGSSNRMFAF